MRPDVLRQPEATMKLSFNFRRLIALDLAVVLIVVAIEVGRHFALPNHFV